MDPEFVNQLALFIQLCLTIALMSVGLAFMIGGASKGKYVAWWIFIQPLHKFLVWSWKKFVAILKWLLGIKPKKKKKSDLH